MLLLRTVHIVTASHKPPPACLQCGFAQLESGTVRNKNVRNILLKNLIDAAISVFCWWSVGYAFAYGSGGPFIGWSKRGRHCAMCLQALASTAVETPLSPALPAAALPT